VEVRSVSSQEEVPDQVEYRKLPYTPNYWIGSDGSVWGRTNINAPAPSDKPPSPNWRKMAQTSWGRKKGFERYQVKIFIGSGKYRNRHVPQLVLEAFVGPRPPGMECCHNDENPTNNRLTNLRWDTKRGNFDDVIKLGTQRGERNGHSKLTEDQVRSIRAERCEGARVSALARKYGVSVPAIADIVKRRNWKHVEDVAVLKAAFTNS
jgi:hypothetical protein